MLSPHLNTETRLMGGVDTPFGPSDSCAWVAPAASSATSISQDTRIMAPAGKMCLMAPAGKMCLMAPAGKMP